MGTKAGHPAWRSGLAWLVNIPFILMACSPTPLPDQQATIEAVHTDPLTTAVSTPGVALTLCPENTVAPVTSLEVNNVPAMPEPMPHLAFRDPIFDSCLVRVTDRFSDLSEGDESRGLKNEYSRVQSFNADESRILVRGIAGSWYLYDASSLSPLGQVPVDMDPRWSADDPNQLLYSSETRLMSFNLATGEQAIVHDFAADLPDHHLAAVWTRYEGSPSFDGRYWGLMAEDEEWLTSAYLVYDFYQDRVISTLDTRSWTAQGRETDTVTISPLGNYFLAYMDQYCESGQLGSEAQPCGLMVYDRNLQNGRGLLRIIGHSDTALDAEGREVLVYQDIDTDFISMLDLASGQITALWPIDFSNTPIGLHISGRAALRPGWALISTHDGDPGSYTWLDDQVFAIELKPGGKVARLAHTHSLVDEAQEHDYWAEPHASSNRDLTRILFTTNWGRSGTEEVEMFMILLPEDWTAQLP